MKMLLFFLCAFSINNATAQPFNPADSLRSAGAEHPVKRTETVSLLLYNRTIVDANGNLRIDQNIVPTIRLNKRLKLELGFRMGERPHYFNVYYHYKTELQTTYFWNVVRFIGRMTTNVIEYPGPDAGPSYTRSNYMLMAELRYPIAKQFTALVGYGHVVTYQRDNYLEGSPVTSGTRINYPLYKLGLRYGFSTRGSVGLSYGLYDVFNPYRTNQPIVQVDNEYDLSKRATLYSYLRYQSNNQFTTPLNSYFCVGVRLHFFER